MQKKLTWLGAGYVQGFSLKFPGSAMFSIILFYFQVQSWSSPDDVSDWSDGGHS